MHYTTSVTDTASINYLKIIQEKTVFVSDSTIITKSNFSVTDLLNNFLMPYKT